MSFLPSRTSILLSIGLAFLGATAYADGGADAVSKTPSAGEFSVRTSSASDGTSEPVRYQYAYGPSDGSPNFETNLIRGILNARAEKTTAPQVLDVFAEDTPEGLAQGEAIAARFRAIAKTLDPSASEAHFAVLVVPVPPKVAGAETRVFKPAVKTLEEATTFGKEFRRAIARPANYETGTVIGTYRAVTSFSTWVSTAGVHPLAAVGITAFETSFSTFHAVFARSMSGVFGMNLRRLGGPGAGKTAIFIRRQIYGLIIAEIERLITGTPHGFAANSTLLGQAQMLAISLSIGGLDAMFSGVRDEKFLEDPVRFARIYLANFFLLTPWQLLDGAGTFRVLLDLHVYKVRWSTIAMLTTYFGMYQSISRAPNKVAFFLDAVFDPVERVLGSVKRVFGQSCKSLFGRATETEI